jgi:hypothetical protein
MRAVFFEKVGDPLRLGSMADPTPEREDVITGAAIDRLEMI